MNRRLNQLVLPAMLMLTAPAYAQESSAPAAAAPAETSVAAQPAAADTAPPASSATAAPPADTEAASDSGAIGLPPEGKAQVVFFRPVGPGMLIACTVHDGDPEISHLAVGKYFVRVTDPGVHTFWVKSEAKDTLKLEVEPGETYYVKCSISMGIMVGRPNLSPSDKATFDKKAKHLKLEKPA